MLMQKRMLSNVDLNIKIGATQIEYFAFAVQIKKMYANEIFFHLVYLVNTMLLVITLYIIWPKIYFMQTS